MNNKADEYFTLAKESLDRIVAEEQDQIIAAAKLFKQCMDNNGIVQLFGLKHNYAFAMELGYRAGGLMPFHKMYLSDLVMKGFLTQQEYVNEAVYDDLSVADKLFAAYNIWDQDMFIISSMAGTEGVAVEVALRAKAKGQKVIAVVNGNAVKAEKSHHPSGKNLVDVADLVLDTLAPYPDLCIEISDGMKMNSLNTICGNIIAQLITVEEYRLYQEANQECPVLLSANLKGADVHNRAISNKYEGRWNS